MVCPIVLFVGASCSQTAGPTSWYGPERAKWLGESRLAHLLSPNQILSSNRRVLNGPLFPSQAPSPLPLPRT